MQCCAMACVFNSHQCHSIQHKHSSFLFKLGLKPYSQKNRQCYPTQVNQQPEFFQMKMIQKENLFQTCMTFFSFVFFILSNCLYIVTKMAELPTLFKIFFCVLQMKVKQVENKIRQHVQINNTVSGRNSFLVKFSLSMQ